MDGLDAEKELSRILQEEIDKVWDEMWDKTPLGYNESSDGYHMGKGLMVNKETWDKYVETLKTKPKLDSYEFMVELVKEDYKKLKNDENMLKDKLIGTIRDVPNFPKEGILFKDITPVLADAKLCSEIVDDLAVRYQNQKIDAIAGIESRGFFFGFLLANRLGIPFIPIRKAGKLPFTTVSIEYALEYGTAKIEMNSDAITVGMNVLIHDDLLATGGTAAAAAELITRQGGTIAGFAFVINLAFLNGSENLIKYSNKINSILSY